MKVIIAGSRTLNKLNYVQFAFAMACNSWAQKEPDAWKDFYPIEIVSGGAQGVDFCGELYAKKHDLLLTSIPADWEKYGKGAGFLRNTQMAKYADRLIAVWDGQSRGTFHMMSEMMKLSKPIYVYCP